MYHEFDDSAFDWCGEVFLRVLGYYFSLRWNNDAIGQYAVRVLGAFISPQDAREDRNPPTPNAPARYSLVEHTPDERYELWYGGDLLIATPEPSGTLAHLFWHVNTEGVRRTGSFFLVHAGSVATPDGTGVILPAASGAGKTTIVAGLVRAGFGYLSDEAAAIDPVRGGLYSYPKALTIKSPSLPLFCEIAHLDPGPDEVRHVTADELRPGSAVPGPCPIGWIVAARYERDAPIEVTTMTPAETAIELARNGMNMPLYGRRALPLLADVVAGARGYRLVSGNLDATVAAITELTAG